MATAIRSKGALRATLCEVEHGVFYVTYPACEDASGIGETATYEMSANSADAKQTIERRARALGYESVMWTETIVVPKFASQPGSAIATARGAAARA